MRLKTYFVNTVEEALLRARIEFGEEAMLVHSKRTSPDTQHLGTYEVVFAAPQNAAPAPPPFPSPTELRKPPVLATTALRVDPPGVSDPSLRRELRALAQMMDRPPETERFRPQEIRTLLDELHGFLAEREVTPKHISELTRNVGMQLLQSGGKPTVEAAMQLLQCQLVSRLPANPTTEAGQLRIIAVLGPAGAGKSTLIAKLAVQEGLAKQQPVHILDLDHQRIRGGDHLQSIAGLLGVPYQRFSSPDAAARAASGIQTAGLVLLDTPGYSRFETSEIAHLGAALAPLENFERHLVLPATLRLREGERLFRCFEACHPTHLDFSRTDESLHFGPAWSLSVQSGLPISWLTAGCRVPEGLMAGSGQTMADLVCDGSFDSPAEISTLLPFTPQPALAMAATVAASRS